ncbi:MAG: RluA family pseudouridine synthase [Oligoflexia bacterium]|nr:RluA family pseudouridine synthase [Oligoflexia bacterium]
MYRIVFEDEFIIGVDKTVTIPCLRQGESAGLSDELLLEFPQLVSVPDFGFTHRLDNETVGVMLVARTKDYYDAMRGLFSMKLVNKTYHARVTGHVEDKKGVIDLPIAHSKKTEKKMVAVREGYRIFRGNPRPARTEWTVLKKSGINTDLELKTSSGVRHQIRVHLHSMGHPVCGDHLYGKHASDYPSLMLISRTIAFKCPVRNSEIVLTSPLTLDNMFTEISM